MMVISHDHPQAFPYTNVDGDGGRVTYLGMSLRDYFAAKALPALIAARHGSIDIRESSTWHLCASIAYDIADAMLAERVK